MFELGSKTAIKMLWMLLFSVGSFPYIKQDFTIRWNHNKHGYITGNIWIELRILQRHFAHQLPSQNLIKNEILN